MKDSRKTARLSTNLKIISRSTGNSIDSWIMNMSTAGAFIKTGHHLPVDAEFTLSLQLPEDPEVMTISGRVVWTKTVSSASPSGMGIQFIDVLPEHEKKIAAYIERNIKQQNSMSAIKLYV